MDPRGDLGSLCPILRCGTVGMEDDPPPQPCALLPTALNLLLKDPVPAVRMKVAETLGRLVRIL